MNPEDAPEPEGSTSISDGPVFEGEQVSKGGRRTPYWKKSDNEEPLLDGHTIQTAPGPEYALGLSIILMSFVGVVAFLMWVLLT